VTALEHEASEWIEPYWNAEHLRRARAWLLELDPDASEALRLAALTHDIERHFPGGPTQDLTKAPEEESDYRRLHAERSASIVHEWLRGRGAPEALGEHVARLIRLHEVGGDPEADLLQAADSLSFLEVNVDLPRKWAAEGRCGVARGLDQHRWMLERIRLDRARELAEPLYARVTRLAA
jgi:Domain of unknown function (DUF4202)